MKKSICFTGHRSLSENTALLQDTLCKQLERLIADGVTDFYAGGALGFDMLAEQTVLQLRDRYPQIHLHLVFPCAFVEQTKKWSATDKQEYQRILSLADSAEFVSERYYNGCMKDRNAKLVELASVGCVCYWNTANYRSGTAQTVRMAEKQGLPIYNLFEMLKNNVKSLSDGLTDNEKSVIIDVSNTLEVTAMPRKKKTDTTSAQAEVKAEVVAETAQETSVAEKPVRKTRKKKAETAPVEVKANAVTETVAETPANEEKPVNKPTTRKTAAKTTAKTASAPKETVKVQFGAEEYDFAEIKKAVEADYKSKVKGKIKTVEIYIKPEDKAVYYVINGGFSDKIEL